jgi:dihydrofolate synthase/folylpolyglutamate synthase
VGAYEETLAYLSGLEVSAGWDLKLERMRAVLERRGHPQAAWSALHVAGTNGKGSTAAMVDAVLTASGYRTGLYTSPHLVDFTERIRIGGRTIPRDTVVALVRELRTDLERARIALTHFEFATLIAFEWFARVGIDVGVIEVGLGGRLDATNVVRPLASAITSIAHDHEEYLGHDLAAIAGEKAGILRTGVPAVIGRLAPVAEAVVAARAAAVGAPLHRARPLEDAAGGLAFRAPGLAWEGLRLGLPGAFQRDNAAVALTVLALVGERLPCSPAAVRAGLADVRWPGRLAVVGERPRVILDGAHNPAGAEALARELPALLGARPCVLVFAVMADKAWRAMLEPLLPFVQRAVVTRVGRRGLAPGTLAEALAARLEVEALEDPRAAVQAGRAAAGADGAVLVTGSLFLVGEAYAALAREGGRLFEPWQGPGGDGTGAPL